MVADFRGPSTKLSLSPRLAAACTIMPPLRPPSSSCSRTLNCLGRSAAEPTRHKEIDGDLDAIDRFLVDQFLGVFPRHGHQEQRLLPSDDDYPPFYLFYGEFCGEHLRCALPRPGSQEAATDCVEEV